MRLLIDADILLYQATSSCEIEKEFEEDVWVLYTDASEAVDAFNSMLGALLEKTEVSDYVLAFSDVKNFRKDLYPDYKGNRKTRKPMGFKVIKEKVFKQHGGRVAVFPCIEADDVLGILGTRSNDVIIWSADKDLKQIPGLHLIDGKVVRITTEQADKAFYMQCLTGDATDNYKGLSGCGPVKAEKLLTFPPYWDRVSNAYTSAGYTVEDALTQARLARILRAEDWDFIKQEVKLWLPATTA